MPVTRFVNSPSRRRAEQQNRFLGTLGTITNVGNSLDMSVNVDGAGAVTARSSVDAPFKVGDRVSVYRNGNGWLILGMA